MADEVREEICEKSLALPQVPGCNYCLYNDWMYLEGEYGKVFFEYCKYAATSSNECKHLASISIRPQFQRSHRMGMNILCQATCMMSLCQNNFSRFQTGFLHFDHNLTPE